MKRWLASFIFATLVAAGGFAAGRGPQVVYFQQQVSVNADKIPLGRLLRLWDEATGMHSTLPRGLAGQAVTVNFSDLPLREAVTRIFEKLPLDYVFIETQGIIIMGRSQAPPVPPGSATAASSESGAVPEAANRPPERMKPAAPAPKPPPPIPTPFGPIPDSGNTMIQLPPVMGPPSPPFFSPIQPALPPAPPASTQDDLFRPLFVYQDPSVPPPGPPPK